MNRFFSVKGIALVLFLWLIFSASTFAGDKVVVKMQGVVMELDLKKGTMVVSERTFLLGDATFYNDRGTPIERDRVKTKAWVYVIGEYDKSSNERTAKKVYLLRGEVTSKNSHLYPFME